MNVQYFGNTVSTGYTAIIIQRDSDTKITLVSEGSADISIIGFEVGNAIDENCTEAKVDCVVLITGENYRCYNSDEVEELFR